MDNIVITRLKRYRLQRTDTARAMHWYLFTNMLHTAATAISFFLPYYFVVQLHLSLLQAGLLMSFYGVGIFLASLFNFRSSQYFISDKIIPFALIISAIAFADFLYFTTFVALAVNLILLGLAHQLFKMNYPHLLRQQDIQPATMVLQKLYKTSNFGLGLTMLMIVIFTIRDVKMLCMIAMAFSILPLFYLPTPSLEKNISSVATTTISNKLELGFCLSLLFLGGLLLAQLTVTYGIYLALQFPHLGLAAMAIFMLIQLIVISVWQKPLHLIFNRGDKLFRAGCGALLMGLSSYSLRFGHAFSLVVFSAMVLSLGELLFISNLQALCNQHEWLNRNRQPISFFQSTLTLSLIVSAALSGYIYQTFGATYLWQGCGYIGLTCFVLTLLHLLMLKIKPSTQPSQI